jgi:AIPR protein
LNAIADGELLAQEVASYRVGDRTASAALLAWFLTAVWRLEPEDVEAAICDGSGDKGIDAIVVDDDLGEITVVQGKWREFANKTQGDNDLKALVGAAQYFASPATIDGLIASKPNAELLKLLERQAIRSHLEQGTHLVKLIFVTNAELDSSGSSYLAARLSQVPELEVWNKAKLVEVARRSRRAELRPETIKLIAVAPPTFVELTAGESLAVALVAAADLVARLPGIDDLTIFSRNVRYYAGKTRINKELQDTVQKPAEHRLFPAFHNGLTLLTEGLAIKGTELELRRVGVVNGCQSLVTLAENRKSITGDLLVLVKIVKITLDNDVADKITYRSNNQNTVTLRDQRSSDLTMRDLQEAVRATFGSTFALRIRVGQKISATRILDNMDAAQLIMAAYLKEPWSAVRKVRLFDQDFRRIFSRAITPHRLYLLQLMDSVISKGRASLRADLSSSFASIRFTLVYLLAQVLRESPSGEGLLDHPEAWLPVLENETVVALGLLVEDVIESVNFHIQEEEEERGPEYDPKVVFKSRAGVVRLENDVLRQSRRQAKRSPGYFFGVASAEEQ